MTWWQWLLAGWALIGAIPSLLAQLVVGGACYSFCNESPIWRRLDPLGLLWSIIIGAIYGPIMAIIAGAELWIWITGPTEIRKILLIMPFASAIDTITRKGDTDKARAAEG